jgi:hypothetical protein
MSEQFVNVNANNIPADMKSSRLENGTNVAKIVLRVYLVSTNAMFVFENAPYKKSDSHETSCKQGSLSRIAI